MPDMRRLPKQCNLPVRSVSHLSELLWLVTCQVFEFELAGSRTSKSPVVIMAGQVRTSDAPKPRVAMHLDFPARCPIGRECRPVGIDMDSAWSLDPQQPTNKAIPLTRRSAKVPLHWTPW